MRENFFSTKTIHAECGKVYALNYYILVDEIDMDNGIVIESYGIKITKGEIGGEVEEKAAIHNISFKSLEIYDMIVLLSDYTVTPVSVYEVLDDFLAS
jgi:hypothetical protein